MKKIGPIFIIIFLLIPSIIKGINSLDVVINELAWMGTPISANDEWIELYNNTQSPIDISGWTLKAEDGSPTITLKGIIPALGYFLLERTDDKTLPNISADQIYTGGLENNGEKLGLYDKNGNLIDLIDCSPGWFGGDNTTKQTMERKNPNSNGDSKNWQTSLLAGGTPKTPNSAQSPTPSPTPIPTADNTPSGTETDNDKISPTNIFTDSLKISEFIPNPTGNDEENEWIELHNDSESKIDISNWKLKSGDKSFTIPEQTFILPNEFLVLGIKTTGLTLKNSDGALELYFPNGAIAQKIDYQETKEGWSIAKIGNEYLWTNNPTLGSANKASSEKIENAVLNISESKIPSPNPNQSPQNPPEDKNENLSNEISPTPLQEEQKSPAKNNSWLALIGIIVFGFLAGLGLVKIRREE